MIINIKPMEEELKKPSQRKGGPSQRKIFINRVLGTDFRIGAKFEFFAKRYGWQPFIRMVADARKGEALAAILAGKMINNELRTAQIEAGALADEVSRSVEAILESQGLLSDRAKEKCRHFTRTKTSFFLEYSTEFNRNDTRASRGSEQDFLISASELQSLANSVLRSTALRLLYYQIRPALIKFQSKVSAIGNLLESEPAPELIDYLLREASNYGIEMTLISGKQEGEPLGAEVAPKDFRGKMLLLLARELEARGRFQKEPLDIACKVCKGPIDENLYDGIFYCSEKCANEAKNKKDFKKFTDGIRRKAERQFKGDSETLRKIRKDLRVAIAGEEGEAGVIKVCKKYGIDPEPKKAGRPKKNP